MSVKKLNENLRIEVAKPEDGDRMIQFLRLHYYPDEPLTAGCVPPEPEPADEEFLLTNLQHGLCVLVLDTENAIVGAAVAGPKAVGEADHLFEEAAKFVGTKWGRILGILARAEHEANVFERYGVKKAAHLHAIGVHTSNRGQSIGYHIVSALIKLAQEQGYPLFTVDCSSLYTARLVQKLGYEKVNTIPYASYVDSAGNQIIQPPAPHEFLETYALRV